MNKIRALCALIVLVLLGHFQPTVHAQDIEQPVIEIIDVNSEQFPLVELSVGSGNLASELGTLPVRILEDRQIQEISSDRFVETDHQLMVVLDPRRIFEAGQYSEERYLKVAGSTLNFVEKGMFARDQDHLAAYSMQANGELQVIQAWTQEPNLIYNSIIKNRPEEIGSAATDSNVAFSNALVLMLEQFQAVELPQPLPRAMILFSAGAEDLDLVSIVTAATSLNVKIHTIEMSSMSNAPGADSALSQLAMQTNGRHIWLESTKHLEPLMTRIAMERSQRFLTYQSNATAPQNLQVQIELADGSYVENSVSIAGIGKSVGETALDSANIVSESDSNPGTAQEQQAPVPIDTSGADVEIVSSEIVIPGTNITIPITALLLALPFLVIAVAYFGYRQLKEQNVSDFSTQSPTHRTQKQNSQGIYELVPTTDKLEPLHSKKANTQSTESGSTSIETASIVQSSELSNTQDIVHPAAAFDDDVTVIPQPDVVDNEVTYRPFVAVERPLIGHLMRITDDPSLPAELPIYGLAAIDGESRPIHVGRHSKHNTLVINDKSVSREHAIMIQKGARLYLRDNNSTAGTFLNWKRLKVGEELLLRHTNLISFGEIVYEFRAKGEDEETVSEV